MPDTLVWLPTSPPFSPRLTLQAKARRCAIMQMVLRNGYGISTKKLMDWPTPIAGDMVILLKSCLGR